MKTFILSAVLLTCSGLITTNSFAQETQQGNQKNEEIIIRKNNSSPSKTIIEIDSNNITINGKPLSDYHGDVTVLEKHLGNDNNDLHFFGSPGNFNFSAPENSAFLGVLTAKNDKGAIIKNVIEGSAAQKAGLKKDDIITKLGDKNISSPDDLRNAVQSFHTGDKVTVEYLRDGNSKSVQLELGKNKNTMFDFRIDSLGNFPNTDRNFNFRMPFIPRSFNFNYNGNQPKMGLQIEDTQDDTGVKILNVEEGSPAEKAGLKKDDIITKMNGESIKDINDIRNVVNSADSKKEFKISVKRDKTEKSFNIIIPKKLNSTRI